MKKKILIIFGTRPEYLKLYNIIKIIRSDKRYNLKVLNTAQHSDLLFNHISMFKTKIDYQNYSKKNVSLAYNSIYISKYIQSKIEIFQPNLIIYQGDTLSAFLAAYFANLNSIFSIHIEAGLRTYDNKNPWPEENFRSSIKDFASYHCTPTKLSKINLLNEKVPEAKIKITGNTIVDLLKYSIKKFNLLNYKKNLYESPYIYITIHRRENMGSKLKTFCNLIKKLSKKYKDLNFVIPVHSNPNIFNFIYKYLSNQKNIKLIKPLNYIENLKHIAQSEFVISDSGGIQEEVASLKKFILIYRDTTERPEILESYGILTNDKNLLKNFEYIFNLRKTKLHISNPFGDGRASDRVYKLINNVL